MKSCGGVALPLGFPRAVVGSPFGMRNTRTGSSFHPAVDLHAPEGTTVHSILEGTVVAVAPTGKLDHYGNTVVVKHAPQLFILYAHLQRFAPGLQVGASIPAGALLGYVGRTAGTSTEPSALFQTSKAHLHLEVLSRWPAARRADRTDPALFLAQLGISVPASGRLTLWCPEDLPARAHAGRIPPKRGGGGGDGLLLLAALVWARQSRN